MVVIVIVVVVVVVVVLLVVLMVVSLMTYVDDVHLVFVLSSLLNTHFLRCLVPSSVLYVLLCRALVSSM